MKSNKLHSADNRPPVLEELESSLLLSADIQGGIDLSPLESPVTPAERSDVQPPIVSRLAEDPRMRPIIAKFTVRLAEKLAAMETALATGDFDELARLTHWLKGTPGNVGFDAFTEPARELEQHVLANNADESKEGLAVLEALLARIVS